MGTITLLCLRLSHNIIIIITDYFLEKNYQGSMTPTQAFAFIK